MCPVSESKVTDEIDAFHAHLDVCRQCRDHPFQLCRTGAELLVKAGASADRVILGTFTTKEKPHGQ
jgi:hypothetical protein